MDGRLALTTTIEDLRLQAELAQRLKHDLGKYIRFRTGWVGPDASVDERRAALVADVHETRKGPDGSMDAQTVWREALEAWGDPWPEASRQRLEHIRDAMGELEALGDLREADEAVVMEAERVVAIVAEEVRDLARELRTALRERER